MKRFNFAISANGNTVYLIGFQKAQTAIYLINLKNINSPEVINLGWITKLAPLGNGNLLLCGNIKDQSGIFLFNPKNKEYKILIPGNIDNFSITQKGNIAYITTNNQKGSDLHVAHIMENSIESDEMIYSDLNYFSFLDWSPSEKTLFCISNQISQSSIYRFTLRSDS